MLSFDYVSNCNSPEALQQIVETLSAVGSQHYPSLLRKAKQQLESINETTVVRNDNIPTVHFSSTSEVPLRDSTLYVSSTKDESSLALSLSSSILGGASAAEEPAASSKNPNHVPYHLIQNTGIPRKEATTNEQTEAKLLAEIERLSKEISTLRSSNCTESTELQGELKALEEAKCEAESKVTVLEKAVLSSSSHAREANAALANVRKESRLLKDLLDGERNAARSEINEAKAIEEELRQKINTISAQLAQCKEQNADIAKSMESRFRRQVEKECAKRDGDVRFLQQSLQNAQATLHAMQEERRATLRSIHQALGKPTDGVCMLCTYSLSNSRFILTALFLCMLAL